MKCAVVMAGWFLVALNASASEEGVTFFRERVKPILEEHCFKCHGGAGKNGEPKVRGNLQLISRKGVMMGGSHGPAVDLENPDESVMMRALSYQDEDLEMPPRGKLPEEQRDLIRQWIEMGAPWTPEDAERLVEVHDSLADVTEVNEKTRAHWSYRPMQDPSVPQVVDEGWPLNPVDAFVLAKLEKESLKPAEGASKAELLRRLSYDLTGLPPSLDEIRAFEADASPDAWSKEVDRLLDSSGYGERWARHWLDLVRYAESNGFERDGDKPEVWRYRDYVIRSFNQDKPYDRFLIEQLAGDEMEGANLETHEATGFLRLMQWDDEPADRKQYEFDILDDMVRTTSEGMLGMTLGCARCHDHKGDPMPQVDYYRFMAFFRGIKPFRRGNLTEEVLSPDALVVRGRQAAQRKKEIEEIRTAMELVEREALSWLATEDPERAERIGDQGIHLLADARHGGSDWFFTTEKPAIGWSEVGFRAELEGWTKGRGGFGTPVPNAKPVTSWKTPTLWLQTSFGLDQIPKALSVHLYHDEDCEVYLNGELVLTREGFVTNYHTFDVPKSLLDALQIGRNVVAVRVQQTIGGQFFDMGLEQGAVSRTALVMDPATQGISATTRKNYARLQEQFEKLSAERPGKGLQRLVVAEKGAQAPPLHVHIRGSAHAEGEKVEPGFPLIFGGNDAVVEPIDGRSSGRRLALAKWITDPRNPRTARVMVNRIWQHHFGRGLCPTPSDFGYLGEGVSHPELLDWLASRFIEEGWSMKAMHRLILNSKTYRMSSRAEAPAGGVDASNSLLWRARPRRLAAEEIRDSMLLAGGVLNRKMHGPSFYVPLPKEVLATSSTKGGKWGKSSQDEARRRSIYAKVKRSLAPPEFSDFDSADTDSPCPVRFSTTVPTQSLAMLNSAYAARGAKLLAERMKREESGNEERVRRAFEWVLCREPDAQELQASLAFLNEQQERHGMNADQALQRFALAVLNFNEFIYLD